MIISNINLSSEQSIRDSISNLKANFVDHKCWTPKTNKYLLDAVKEVKNDVRSNTISNTDATDYIACSSFIHCFNAWNYLSLSVNALLEGDYGGAIHNAYYGELRSMMAFLGSQGVGVFSGDNLIIKSGGIVESATYVPPGHKRMYGGTHDFAKTALDDWLSIASNSSSLLSFIKVENCSLLDWINATGYSAQSSAIFASDWIKKWSLDMTLINNDHNIRNIVSYRPQFFDVSVSNVDDRPSKRIEMFTNIWELSKPSNIFQRHVLRSTLEHLYFTVAQYPDLKPLNPEADFVPIFQRLGLTLDSQSSQDLINFLRREPPYQEDNFVFRLAKIGTPNPITEFDVDPYGIIARTTLLLNFVTSVVKTLMVNTRTSRRDLDFWFNHIGTKMGIWKPGEEPDLLIDLWSDLESEFESIANAQQPGLVTNFEFKSTVLSQIGHSKNFSRAYLWNLER